MENGTAVRKLPNVVLSEIYLFVCLFGCYFGSCQFIM